MNNRIENDQAALKRLLRPMRGFRNLFSATATLKDIEGFRAIRKVEFDVVIKGVTHETAFVTKRFKVAT